MPVLQSIGSDALRAFGFGVGGGAVLASYELITTTVLAANATTVTFNLPAGTTTTYKHLQFRGAILTTVAPGEVRVYKNAITSGYWAHFMEGNGTTVTSNYSATQPGFYFSYEGAQRTSSSPLPFVLDFLDYANASKNLTVRGFSGAAGSAVRLISSSLADTATPTSYTFTLTTGQYAIGTRISLYGVRA